MIILDYRDKRPIYEQVTEKLQNLIVRGVLEPDSKMPSVRSLALELTVNPNTIQRAYMELEKLGLIYPEKGYIYTVKGRGNYVAKESEWRESREHLIDEETKTLAKHALEAGISKEHLISKLEAYYGEERL